MKFILRVKHKAEYEGGLNAFLIFIKDNLSAGVIRFSAESESLLCSAEFEFDNYNNLVAAVQAFRAEFTIEYIVKGD